MVRDTVDEAHDERLAVKRWSRSWTNAERSDEGADVEVDAWAIAAAGVVDDDRPDPPEPNEPG